MKMRYNILVLAVAALAVVACTNKEEILDFKTDVNIVEAEADGGVKKVRIQSSDEWIALVEQNAPWISVSPANGRGTVTCDFVIDSALTAYPREAKVAIRNVATNKDRYITVKQKGYEYALDVDRKDVEVKKFAEFGKRYFDVVVKSNFAFDVKVPKEQQFWISREPASNLGDAYKHNLDRGVRPREVKVRFNWKINNSENPRLADIEFVPIADTITVSHSSKLRVSQEAAEKIVADTRAGDSLALLNIVNTMQCWTIWDSSTPMNTWNGVTLWDRRDGCSADKIGRVRKVEIFLCNSFEGLPYEFKYLTAAEEIYIFSNENSMLKSLNLGEHICEKYTEAKKAEWADYQSQVTEWEIGEYLHKI